MPGEAFANLLEDFEQLTRDDVNEMTIQELEDLCLNPIFQLLCRICESLFPGGKKR